MRIPMMPKGVEHLPAVHGLGHGRQGVRIPMMPKGVEHNRPKRLMTIHTWVRIPMMPKGVEHIRDIDIGRRWKVRIPMMPKGVEHSILSTDLLAFQAGANSDDAERR